MVNETVFYRLTALWVICEAFAGGILHGLKIPFSGMLVSSLAVMCIILLAWHVPSRAAILKATIIVAIFKLMLSPHAPPTAYVAVFFQGALGQLLLRRGSFFKPAAVLFAVLALVESSLQRLFVLLLLYGNDFWTAVNKYLQKLTGSKEMEAYTWWIAGSYIFIHFLAGIAVGWYAAKLARQSSSWHMLPEHQIVVPEAPLENLPVKEKKRKKVKILFVITWLLLTFMFVQAYFYPTQALLPRQEVVRILLRSLLIVLSWYLLLLPLLTRFVKAQIEKQQFKRSKDVGAVLNILPHTKYIFVKSWEMASAEKQYFQRLKSFFKILLLNVLYQKKDDLCLDVSSTAGA